MSTIPWTMRAAFAVTASGLALSGCSSDSAAPEATVAQTTAATESAPPAESSAPAETTSALASPAGLPAAPADAEQIDSENDAGMQYSRYKVSGTSAKAIVDGYATELESAGYSILDEGGSGGGWGRWGGSGYGMGARNDNTFVSVQAGGSTNGPTYFEVCVGPNRSVVKQCAGESSDDENDDSDSTSSGS